MLRIVLTDRQRKILVLIHEHYNASQIAKALGISPPAVSKNIAKLEEMRLLIEELPRSRPKTYKLTLPAYSQVNKSSRGREEVNLQTPKYDGLHHIRFKVPVKKWSKHYAPDRVIKLRNWEQGLKDFPTFHLRSNPNSLEFWWDERTSDDPKVAQTRAEMRIQVYIAKFEKAGFVFGDAQRIQPGKHSIIKDKFIQKKIKHTGRIIYKGKGSIDETPDEDGTLHFDEAQDVVDYMDMPSNLKKLERRLAGIEMVMSKQVDAFEKLSDNLQRLIDKLTPKELERPEGMYR